MPILALDVGEKKIGVAISETGLVSHEFCTIHKSQDLAFGEIVFLAKRKNIDIIVVGLPLNKDGSQAKKIKNFTKKLKKFARVVYEDESLTSKEAERILFGLGLSLDKVRERRDQMSAKIILDQYLDEKLKVKS